MGNFFWTKQDILIDNLQLGYNGPNNSFELQPVVDENGDEILGFGHNFNESYSINVRPDIWVFPFLNVYGIFGFGRSHTEVNINRLGSHEFDMTSVVDQGISTAGFGVLVAGGVGPVWISGDFNFTWNKPELLDKATRVNILGIRLGHTFVFKNHPESNIGLWVGGMRLAMATETSGAIKMIDALPPETWERRDEIVSNYWDWYDGLNPNKPGDAKKIEIADNVLTPIVDRIDAADGDAIIRYGMDKQTKQLWNGVIGMQYQLNKRWQFRTEAGIIGDRKSALVSVNYRFMGFRTNSYVN